MTIGVSVFSSIEVSFSVPLITSGVDVVEGLGLGAKRGVRNSHPSR